jgi:phosphonate transport system permease protein
MALGAMASAPRVLPEAQLEPLLRAYRDAAAAKRARLALGAALLVLAALGAGWTAEVRPDALIANLGDFASYFGRLAVFDSGPLRGHGVWTAPGEWFWGLGGWLSLLLETILMAYLATLLGSAGAFFLSFQEARNLAPGPWTAAAAKRLLELCRTVPEIVFALIFVVAFGLGPLPGVLAIAIHTLGANGKLFAEVAENIDMKPVEGAYASGATRAEAIRYAALPQVLPGFASYVLLRFETNVRGASVMGFVGAGGIGMDLVEAIRKFYYADVSAMLLLLLATVFLIDTGTQALRHALLGREAR